MISNCCKAPVKVEGMGDFHDADAINTMYHVCEKCQKPCDAYHSKSEMRRVEIQKKPLFTIEELRQVAHDSNHDQMVKSLAAQLIHHVDCLNLYHDKITKLEEDNQNLKRAMRKIYSITPKKWIEKVTTDGTRKGTHVETITVEIDSEEIKQLQAFLNPEENE